MSLISIINTKVMKIKQEIFIYLKNNNTSRKNNYNSNNNLEGFTDYSKIHKNFKMAIILNKLNTQCKNIFQLYKYYRLNKKFKYFSKWKNLYLYQMEQKKIDQSIKEKISKIFEDNVSNINKEIKNKEKIIEVIKKKKIIYPKL